MTMLISHAGKNEPRMLTDGTTPHPETKGKTAATAASRTRRLRACAPIMEPLVTHDLCRVSRRHRQQGSVRVSLSGNLSARRHLSTIAHRWADHTGCLALTVASFPWADQRRRAVGIGTNKASTPHRRIAEDRGADSAAIERRRMKRIEYRAFTIGRKPWQNLGNPTRSVSHTLWAMAWETLRLHHPEFRTDLEQRGLARDKPT
jgi:hypothetical protein